MAELIIWTLCGAGFPTESDIQEASGICLTVDISVLVPTDDRSPSALSSFYSLLLCCPHQGHCSPPKPRQFVSEPRAGASDVLSLPLFPIPSCLFVHPAFWQRTELQLFENPNWLYFSMIELDSSLSSMKKKSNCFNELSRGRSKFYRQKRTEKRIEIKEQKWVGHFGVTFLVRQWQGDSATKIISD